MIDNKNFCIQPWIHLASWNDGKVPLCCVASPEANLNFNDSTPQEIWNSEQFKRARLRFMNGEQPSQCSACWKEEASGIKSHRVIENDMWKRKMGAEKINHMISLTNPDGSVDFNPITLDLRIGNTCNLQCVMCRPRDSSKWLNDSKKLAQTLTSPGAKSDWDFKSKSIANTDCFEWFEKLETQDALDEFMGDIRHIIFGGGEPLLIKGHERFITKLVESGHSKNIELRYHTNGTQLSEKFIDLWSQFKLVELMISLDDWGQRNEFVRWPASWEVISKNLDRLDETADNIVVNILATVHAMNIYNLPDFAQAIIDRKWKKICKRNEGLFSVGTTHWPQYLSTTVLPPNVKEIINKRWEEYPDLVNHPRWINRIKYQFEYMTSRDDSDKFPDLMNYIDTLELMRPIKFSEVYSDYYKLLKGI